MNHKLKDKKQKIGLVLGGGGAKGAYQAGVLKALKEANILPYVTHVSANSIGSINALMVVDEKIEGCAEVWKTISKKDALKLKSKSEKGGIFSRNGLIKILENRGIHIDVAHLNKKSFIEFSKMTKYPIFCSHTSSRLVYDIPRALDREQMSIIKESKGFVGLCLYSSLLSASRAYRK